MHLLRKTSILLLLLAAGSATASTVRYDCAETNGSFTVDCAIGESQLVTTVIDDGTGATFKFQNLGSAMSIISNIYFDDTVSSLLNFRTVAVDDVDNGPLNNIGVDFTNAVGPVPATPADLPGAVPFDVSFAIGRDNRGGIARGVNNAVSDLEILWETLEISANYGGGADFSLLTAALDSGAFQIGLKVQSFTDDGSEWFTSTTISPIPLPASVWLFGSALIGFIGYSRRRIV